MSRDPVCRAIYDCDRDEMARLTVGVFRMRYAALAGQAKFENLFNELITGSPESHRYGNRAIRHTDSKRANHRTSTECQARAAA
jgi:hypothetical protein